MKRLLLLLMLLAAACALFAADLAGAVTPQVRPYRFLHAGGAWSQADAPRISGANVICVNIQRTPSGVGPATSIVLRDAATWAATSVVARDYGEPAVSAPDICGNIVTWSDDLVDGIVAKNIATGVAFPVCTADGSQAASRVSSQLVVWADARDAAANGWDVYGYDLKTGSTFPICRRGGSQTAPDVWGSTVVWVDRRNGDADIYGARVDPATGKVSEFPICTAVGDQTQCAVSGKWVVWTDARSGQPDIYGFNLETQKEFPIATGPDVQNWPDVDTSTVVWAAASSAPYPGTGIQGFNLHTGVNFPIWSAPEGGASQLHLDKERLVWKASEPGEILLWFAELDWGTELQVQGAPTWVTDPALTLEAAAVTPGTWVTDVRFSANGGATWSAWQALKATSPYTLPPGEGERTVTAQFRDHLGGLSPTVQASVGLDTVAPTSGHDGDSLWHNQPVTVRLVASDATSGVARTEYRLDADAVWHTGTSLTVAAPADHSADGVHTVGYRSIDVAGNVEPAKSCQVRIDTTPPTTTDNADGAWHAAASALVLTPTDALSGVAKTEYRIDGGAWQSGALVSIAGDGLHAVDYRSTDAAGNVEEVKTCEVKVDATAPVTTASGADDAWHASPVTVRLSASDALSGVALTEYRLDGGAWTAGSELTVTADGAHTLAYRSRDAAGNLEADKTVTVRIDAKPPVTSCDAPGSWANHAVTVRFAATDAGIGVDYTEYDLDGLGWARGGSVIVYDDGVHALSLRSVDLLGHIEATRTFTVRIDTRGPTTKALAKARVRRGRTATLRYRVSDALSPKAKVTIRIKTRGGRTAKTLKAVTRKTNVATSSRFTCKLKKGTYRFHIYARDLAGNKQVRKGYGTLVVR